MGAPFFGGSLTLALSLLLLAGCPAKPDDSAAPTGTSPTDTTVTDTQPTGECLSVNEDCGPGTCDGKGEDMLPGSDCLSCHSPGSGEDEAPAWTVAGTVFSNILGTDGTAGAVIRVTDSTGTTVTLESSGVGNFYTSERLTPPLTAKVETDGVVGEMSQQVETGACNSCHQCDGAARGKLYR